MKAVVINGPGSLEIVEKPVPVPGAGEILVRVKYCGICGSDLHAFETGFLQPGLTIGHEFSGIIEQIGPGCTGFTVGDKVTGNNIITCGCCSYCLKGAGNLCVKMRKLGITDDGALAEYIRLPAKDTIILPEHTQLEHAALTEPLSIGLHAINKVTLERDGKALIYGGGTIGLVLLALLTQRGIKTVVIEPNPYRASVAEAMGASAVLDPGSGNLDSKIKFIIGSKGANLVFECAGLPETIQEACNQGAAGSTVVVLSICHQPVVLNFLSLVTQEINIKTAFGKTAGEFKDAAGMIVESSIDLSGLISKIVPLAAVEESFHLSAEENIKTLVSLSCL